MDIINNLKLNMSEASSAPIYQQLQEQLLDYIQREKLAPGTRLPDVKTLATAAGVGVKTACRALDGLVNEGICCRRPKKGTFIADAITALNHPEQRNIVGLFHFSPLTDENAGTFAKMVFDGVSSEAERRNTDLIFMSGDTENTLRQYASVPGLTPRGMLVFSENYSEILSLAVTFPHMRFVIVNFYHEGFEDTPDNIYGVFNDDFGGSYTAADRFIAEGARHIGYLNMRLSDDNYLMREQGAAAAAADSNVMFTALDIPYSNKQSQMRIGYEAAPELLQMAPDLDVVMAANDNFAVGMASYLDDHMPGHNIRICGYDWFNLHLPYINTINSIAINFHRMGEKAIDMITGEKPRTKMLKLFPQLLIK